MIGAIAVASITMLVIIGVIAFPFLTGLFIGVGMGLAFNIGLWSRE